MRLAVLPAVKTLLSYHGNGGATCDKQCTLFKGIDIGRGNPHEFQVSRYFVVSNAFFAADVSGLAIIGLKQVRQLLFLHHYRWQQPRRRTVVGSALSARRIIGASCTIRSRQRATANSRAHRLLSRPPKDRRS